MKSSVISVRAAQRSVIVMALLQPAVVSMAMSAPSEQILTNALTALSTMQTNWQQRETAAKAVADRFLHGGQLWVAGSIPGFAAEWLNRAGGLMEVRVMRAPGNVAAGDALIYGCLPGAEAEDAKRLRTVHEQGGLVVAFGSASQSSPLDDVADHLLRNDLPADTPMSRQVAVSMNLAHLWAFTGDLVGACTRGGKMPTMWQSVMVPGAKERNARYRPLRFHEDRTVSPVQPGKLGNQYLRAIAGAVSGLRKERKKIAAAGAAIRQTLRSGHTVFHASRGHFQPARLLPAGCGISLTLLPSGAGSETELRKRGAKGDCAVILWYTDMPTALLRAARELNLRSVCSVATNPAETHDTSLADIFIDPQWVFGDATVQIPGYDVKVLPPSGVLDSLVFYALLAEAK